MAYMNPIKTLLNDRGVLLIDGAMGTMLMDESKEKKVPAEMLNIISPDTIISVHEKYIQAGCDIITANTFGANENKIDEKRYDASIEEVVSAAIKCAKEAVFKTPVERDVKVALNIGALGQIIGILGDLEHEDAKKMFARQVKAGASAGADLILIETMSDLEEVRDAVLAAKECSDLPILCTMSFNESGKTFMGASPKAFALLAEELDIDAIGANCSLSPAQMLPIIDEILANTDRPVIVQPNAGIPTLENGIAVYDLKEDEFSIGVCDMLDRGVLIVGGCCGTSPNFINILRKSIEKRG